MQKVYPDLYRSALVYAGSAEESLQKLTRGSFDVVCYDGQTRRR